MVDVSLQQRSNDPTSYNHREYSHIIDWRRRCLIIQGVPIVLISAEFHYFRVPDRSRWRQILVSLRGAGFNCIRLYFHWGYHSPAEGLYDFTGARDIHYLLTLCEELNLFVISAPGPYICAETQAGGYPTWLIAKRHLRIRHLKYAPMGIYKYWDDEFHQHCVAYFQQILPILIKHERTTNPGGCIILMQLENELREMTIGSVGGVDEEIRKLAEVARECGSTVPFFHNDDNPIGSWARGKPRRKLRHLGLALGMPMIRTDLYGTDLYFTFPPGDRSGDKSSCQVGMIELGGVAACLQCCGIGGSGVGGSDTKYLGRLFDKDLRHAPPPRQGWTPKQLKGAVDNLEKKFENIGGSACHAPPIIAEAQVGWINQWARLRDYDDVYNFFGEFFSSTFLCSLAAQGIVCSNHYMGYGGTNYGCLSDTEVYSSYDYGAFIREYGKLSDRGRRFRQTALFLRSFAEVGLAETDPVGKKDPHLSVQATLPDVLLNARRCTRPEKNQNFLSFCFLRNLTSPGSRFNLIVDSIVVPCFLPLRDSLIIPLYYRLRLSYSIFTSTIPVLCRTSYAKSELWVLNCRHAEKGRVIIKADDRKDFEHVRKLRLKWSTLSTIDRASFSGQCDLSERDEGAASSYLSAPLEELPLGEWEDLPTDSPAVVGRVSTEEIGLCFSLRLSGAHLPCAISVSDVGSDASGQETETVILRIVAISEADADTFTTNLDRMEGFNPNTSSGKISPRFMAAWGPSEITILPSLAVQVAVLSDEDRVIFVLCDRCPEEKLKCCDDFIGACEEVQKVIPGVFIGELSESSLHTEHGRALTQVDAYQDKCLLNNCKWERHIVDWSRDTVWLPIKYEERSPLSFHMTSGHVAYRVRFKASASDVSVKVNLRHVGMLWCNNKAIGGYICYSHNAVSAGAMHAFDISWAGYQRYSLKRGLAEGPNADGFHTMTVLVQSFGQSRSPFLLNDVRNQRGLLGLKFSRLSRVSEVDWAICGIPVSSISDPFNTSGLPFEGRANDTSSETGFTRVSDTTIKTDDGLVYFRTSFDVPIDCLIGSKIRFPLRIKVARGNHLVAMFWVNGTLIGRFVDRAGPQFNFYIPEGMLEAKRNLLVVAAYAASDSQFKLQILPWIVDSSSGNLNEQGQVYAADIYTLSLMGKQNDTDIKA